jgi:8-oxo-dGTP pyrophosphatase MutT (NUDIX family)
VLAVSRRGVPSNLGFPGGGIEPGENAAQCAARELKEETTLVVDVRALRPLFDRQDGNQVTVCRTFGCDLHEARGMAKSVEPGIVVSWVPFRRLLLSSCTFHTYNAALFQSLGIRC